MELIQTAIAGAFIVRRAMFRDARGEFGRLYCAREFEPAGLRRDWAQVNHSRTLAKGSIRGMHYQLAPHAEAKLVHCVSGRAFDVAVDVRRGSPTFLQWTGVEIDEETSFFVPEGCAHGFQALTDDVHLVYMASNFYEPHAEAGLRFDDPAIAIDWPLPPATLSDRDRSFPLVSADFAGLEP